MPDAMVCNCFEATGGDTTQQVDVAMVGALRQFAGLPLEMRRDDEAWRSASPHEIAAE